jgi:uncharacterized MnhB-related membrane protein
VIPLQSVVIALVAAASLLVVLTRDLVRLALLSSVFGLLLVVFFLVLQAPDVSLSMLVVSTVAYPLIVLLAISRTRREKGKD